MDVTAVELVDKNLEILREKSKGIGNIKSIQGEMPQNWIRLKIIASTLRLYLVLYITYEKEELIRQSMKLSG